MFQRFCFRKGNNVDKEVVGYEFGCYWFPVAKDRKQPIKGLCGDGFSDERDLCSAYDDTGQGCGLVRCYKDGSRLVLREALPRPKADG